MENKKELTVGKATLFIIILYSVFTIILGYVFVLISIWLNNILPIQELVATIITVVFSILMMYISWKLSVLLVLRKKSTDGLDTKKVIRNIIIFIVLLSAISMIYDLYEAKLNIDRQYSNDFLEDRDVIAAFTQEELQERANLNDLSAKESAKHIYPLIIGENVLSIFINILIISLVPKKMLESHDGIIKIEKETNNN